MAQLLDPYGRPVKRQALLAPQAQPGLTGVRTPFADTIASGLTPAKLAKILRAADEGDIHEYVILAEEMEERDPHYFSVLGSRKRVVSGVEPVVKPASESAADRKIAEAVKEHIVEHDGFSALIEDMLDGLGKGFSMVEILWETAAKAWTPAEFVWRDQRFFKPDRETGRQLRLLDEANPSEGIELAPFKFIRHTPKLKSGLAIRGGLARVAAFTWMCKAYTLKDWMAFIETYGLPIRIGRYSDRATKEDVEKLFQAVANIGTDAACVLPRSMEIELVSAVNAANGDKVFETLARWGDEQVSKAVAGQTMSSDDGSSMAQAKVHNEVRHDIAAADAKAVTCTLNRDLVKPFVDLNYGVQADYPRVIVAVEEPEDLEMKMRNVYRMAAVGVTFRQAEVRRKLGFGDPEDGEEVFGGAPVPVATNGLALNHAAPKSTPKAPPGPFDDLDEIERDGLEGWEEVAEDLIAPIEAALASASSYEDAMAALTDRLPGLGASKLIDGLVRAMFQARGFGDTRDS